MSFLISSVLFQLAKMIISVLVTRMIVDRNLAVRVLSYFYSCELKINSIKNDRFWLAFADTEFSSSKINKTVYVVPVAKFMVL